MQLRHIRIIELGLLAYIVYLKAWTLMPYWSAMSVSLEILNRQKSYLYQPNYRLYNWFFVGYLVLVVADRTRTVHLNDTFEWCFNSLMHILFGLIVCFKISQYLIVFDWKIKRRLFYIALGFNILGVLNEIMQNSMNYRGLLGFVPDSFKDMVMNIVGTLVFLGIEYVLSLAPSVKEEAN
jgi:hypothetical protein